MRHYAAAMALLLLGPMVGKAQEGVLVLPPQFDVFSPNEQATLTMSMRQTLAGSPGLKLVDSAAIDLAEAMIELECGALDPECLARFSVHFGGRWVVILLGRGRQDKRALELLVYDRSDGHLTRATRTVAKDELLSAALSLLRGAFPARRTPPEPVAKPPGGDILVTSTTKGARVFVGGRFFGRTPLRTNLPVGEHLVRVTSPGRIPFEMKLSVQSGKRVDLTVELRRAPDTSKPVDAVEPERPFYATWWFWTVVGVAVAGTVTLAVVLTQEEEGEPIPTGALQFGSGSPDYDPAVLEFWR